MSDLYLAKFLVDLDRKIDQLIDSVASVSHQLQLRTLALEELGKMAQADIDALRAQVENNSSVTQSAASLIQGLADQIRDMADDPAQIRALADQLQQSSTALAAAVAANTPGG